MLLLSSITACVAPEPPPPPEPEPDFELAWEDDLQLDSDQPACPPGDPDCDRLDEPDLLEAPAAREALADEQTPTPYGLTDPLTGGGNFRKWPRGRIPYRYAKTSSGAFTLDATTRSRLGQAMTNWEVLTEGRIKFRAKRTSDTAYVLVRRGSPRVSPFVGYRAGRVQNLYLRQDEFITVMKHELGHVVGFHHEQRRKDRASHIEVRTGNIVPTTSCKFQFSTCSDCKRIGTYDRRSVMHYRTKDLADCRSGPVLLQLDGNPIDHVWKLSTRDRNSVAVMYAPAAPFADGGVTPPITADLQVETGSLTAAGGCLGVEGESTARRAAIELGECTAADSQDWRATRAGQLRAKHSLRCTAVAGDAAPGALLEQAACADSPEQHWRFEGMELVHGATDSCLGPGLTLAACDGNQRVIDYRPDLEAIVVGDACLGAIGDAIALGPCDGSEGQRWLQARGGFVNRTNTGKCLAPAGGTIELALCSDEAEQRWALRGPIRDARAGLCIDGARLATCDGSSAQRWTFWSR
jgi:hypothetical protein